MRVMLAIVIWLQLGMIGEYAASEDAQRVCHVIIPGWILATFTLIGPLMLEIAITGLDPKDCRP